MVLFNGSIKEDDDAGIDVIDKSADVSKKMFSLKNCLFYFNIIIDFKHLIT